MEWTIHMLKFEMVLNYNTSYTYVVILKLSPMGMSPCRSFHPPNSCIRSAGENSPKINVSCEEDLEL